MAAKSDEKSVVSIPEPDIRSVVITLNGITPLLSDRISEATRKEIEDKQTGKPAMAREFRDFEKEWPEKLYRIPGTDLNGFPAAGIKLAIVAAGYRCIGEQMTRLRAMFTIPCELVPIAGSAPRMRKDMAKLQGKTLTVACRAEFPVPWSMDVPFKFNAALISVEQLYNYVELAGFSIGIGAWRPEKDGNFGQFTVLRADK